MRIFLFSFNFIDLPCRKYRPFYLELGEWPSIFFASNSGSCPFERPTEKHAFAETVVQTSDKETNEDGSSKNMRYGFKKHFLDPSCASAVLLEMPTGCQTI